MLELSLKFKELEQEAIRKLASDNVNEGAEVLPEFAFMFKIAGLGIEDFIEFREGLIRKAEILSENPQLLRMKLEIYERDEQERRRNSARAARASKIARH